jgi:hypothetical protein
MYGYLCLSEVLYQFYKDGLKTIQYVYHKMAQVSSVVVTLTDAGYYQKAKRTIIDVRSRGEWKGDLVLITVGFDAPPNFLDFYRVIPFRVEHLDTSQLVEQYKKDPIRPTCDNRE